MSKSHKVSVIAMAPNDWDGPWMNRQQLLSRLAKKGCSVVYSTGCLNLWERGGEKWKQTGWGSRSVVSDGVTVSLPGKSHVRWSRCKLYDNYVLKKYVANLKALAGWDDGNVVRIAFIFHPVFYPYLEYLNPDIIAYHIYDFHSGMPGSSVQTEAWEKDLIGKCDLLTVTNAAIVAQLDDQGQRKAKILGNGVDTELFGPEGHVEPEELKSIPRPRIGYTGVLNKKIDWVLVDYIARNRPSWHWVFVGPKKTDNVTDPEQVNALRVLQQRSNVHFIGAKPRKEMPSYVSNMNLGAICYRMKEKDWSFFGYPLKLHEYLACGKPVACSPLPAVMTFLDAIALPSTPEEWLQSMERCLQLESDPESVALRLKVARENSWDIRADELEQLLNSEIIKRSENEKNQ